MPSRFHRFNPLKEIIGCFIWAGLIYLFVSHGGPEKSIDLIREFKVKMNHAKQITEPERKVPNENEAVSSSE